MTQFALELTMQFLFWAAIASFMNVIAYRLPLMLEQAYDNDVAEANNQPHPHPNPTSLANPPSTCPKCQSTIQPLHNIPILSYLYLKGKCHHCKTKIPPTYLFMELGMATLCTYYLFIKGINLTSLFECLCLCIAITLAKIDYGHKLLPDALTLPLLWTTLVLSTLDITKLTPTQTIIGATCGYLFMAIPSLLFKIIKGKEGMGYGDFKWLAAIGAILGPLQLPWIILIASTITIILHLKGNEEYIPLGPGLSIGFITCLMWNT